MSKTEVPDQEKEKEKDKLTFVLEGSLKVTRGKKKVTQYSYIQKCWGIVRVVKEEMNFLLNVQK